MFYVVELGRAVRQLAVLDVGDSLSEARFVDLDGDGVHEVESGDNAFMYWTSYVESFAPRVVLRFNGETYELALPLMRKAPPTEAEYKAFVQEVQNALNSSEFTLSSDRSAALLSYMVNLIYTGHPQLA